VAAETAMAAPLLVSRLAVEEAVKDASLGIGRSSSIAMDAVILQFSGLVEEM
jgi:hypothetical protein